MCAYSIRFATDDEMPEGHDFMLVRVGDEFGIFYREGAVTPRVLEDSWAAYRQMLAGHRPPPGLRRVS